MTSRILSHSVHGEPSKPPLLVLHGFLGCKEDWDDIVPLFVRDYFVITADLPGFGESIANVPEQCYTMSGCAQSVLDLLDHLRVDRCNLIGYSMGGRVALYMAVHFPERCRRVVLESSSPGLRTEEERAARRAADETLADKLLKLGIERFIADWYAQPMFDSLRRSDHFESVRQRRIRNTTEGPARSLRIMGTGSQPSLWEDLSRVSVPLLFVAGEYDTKFAALAREMESLCSNGRACVLEGVGHALHFETPERYIGVIREFLQERKQG